MAIRCSSCAHPLSRGTTVCPFCAAPQLLLTTHQPGSYLRLLLISLIALLLIVGSGLIYAGAFPHSSAPVASHRSTQATTSPLSTAPAALYTEATARQPALFDTLTDANRSYWHANHSSKGNCTFGKSGYVVATSHQHYSYLCYAWPVYGDFAFQVQMTLLKGDGGGIIFRADPSLFKFYLLTISTKGTYRLSLLVNNSIGTLQVLASGNTPLINTAQSLPNQLTLIAHGSKLYLYVNQQFLTAVNNSALSTGQIGFCALDETQPTAVAFHDARVWSI